MLTVIRRNIMTATANRTETATQKAVFFMKRMHLFHPERFWAIVIPMTLLILAGAAGMIALPFVM